MSMADSIKENMARISKPPESVPRAKKAYEKPTFRFERIFETMALTCGKRGTQGQCQINRKLS